MKLTLFICFLIIVEGCSSSNDITNISPAYLYSTPSVKAYESFSSNMRWAHTFSVFPYSVITGNTERNSILDEQLLFYVRSLFEGRGYKFVSIDGGPDFLVTLNTSSPYYEFSMLPQSYSVPTWVPGQSISVKGSSDGTFNFNTYGDVNMNGWGNWNQNSTTTIDLPGYATTTTYTRPGYNVGRFYPTIDMFVFDPKTFKAVWTARGVGVSDNSDVRISGQIVMGAMVKEYPSPNETGISDQSGFIGIRLGLFTNNGNSYYPTVLELVDGMPAKNKGMRLYDMIIAIDGKDTRNMPVSEVLNLLRGVEDSKVDLSVWRVDKLIKYTLTRAPMKR